MSYISEIKTTKLVLIDFQERLLNAVSETEACLSKASILMQGALELGIDVLITEQYPKGLGSTDERLKNIAQANKVPIIEKNSFSCFGNEEFKQNFASSQTNTIIVAGVEAHICVLQTALDAKKLGYNVIVVDDAISSRESHNKSSARDFLRSQGCQVMSVETLLFLYLGSSQHPAFRAISKLIK